MKKEKDNNENKKKKFRRFKKFMLTGTLAGIIILAFLQSKNRHTKHNELKPMEYNSFEELDLKEHKQYDDERIEKVYRLYYDDGTCEDFVCYKVYFGTGNIGLEVPPEPIEDDYKPDPTFREDKNRNSTYPGAEIPDPTGYDEDFIVDPTRDDNITDSYSVDAWNEKTDNVNSSKKIGSMNR